MYILDSEIKRVLSSEKEFRYAYFIKTKDILERMTVSLDDSSKTYRINARIAESEEEKYILSLKIGMNGRVEQFHCGCSYSSSQSACRHVGAVLLFLKTLEITSYPYFYEKDREEDKMLKFQLLEAQKQERILNKKQSESLSLIELCKDRLLRESMIPLSNKQYQLKVYVKKEEELSITLKVVSFQSSYIIKNIGAFLSAISNHENLKYSKNFEFVHSRDAFDEDSLDILDFVEECYLRNQVTQKGIIKHLVVDETMIDEFFDLMYSLPSYFCDIAFEQKEYIIPLDIELKEDNYILDFKDYDEFSGAIMSSLYIYTFKDDVLQRYVFDKKGQCLILIQKLLNSEDGLYIPTDSLYDFYKYVLIDLLEYIDIDNKYFKEYHQENFINLYADMTTDDQVCIQLEYIYDDRLEYGFDANNPHISKEAHLIENYLEPYIEDEEDHMIYLQYDHDFAYSFIKEGLPYLSNYAQVFISDNLRSLSKTQEMKISVGVNISHHLLEINIDSINIQKEELFDVLKAYKRKKKFYKLANGQLLSLASKELAELDELTSQLHLNANDLSADKLTIPAYRLFDIEKLSGNQTHMTYNKSDSFNTFITDFKKPQQFEVPEPYKDILRSYQVEGYQWLRMMEHYGFSGILADDMGLGKTLQTIVYLESMKDKENPSLVVTPASLLLNWQDETKKFSKNLKVLSILGTKEERDELIKHIDEYDVIITSYDYLRRDIELYETTDFHTVILDEAQYIKNPKTRNALCVKQLKSKQRFALTGTPIENSLAEMWSIFDFLMPHYLYNYSYFLENFEKPIVKDEDEDKQNELRAKIAPFILRRNKKDVLKELPEKIERTMYYSFSEEEEKLYLSLLVSMNKSLQEKLKIKQLGKVDVLAMLTKLRQVCQDPRILYEDFLEPSSKLKGCMELIHSLRNNNQKILLFSSFTSVLALIEEQCKKEHISYYRLDGSCTKEKRRQMVDAFQKDDTTLFLISLKAGGSGLNLTSAGAVIHFDPWWNMSAKNQATDRAHRIGQNGSVQVFSLIMKNSIEEKIMNLQAQKKNLADNFVEGHSENVATLTMDDLKRLFEV